MQNDGDVVSPLSIPLSRAIATVLSGQPPKKASSGLQKTWQPSDLFTGSDTGEVIVPVLTPAMLAYTRNLLTYTQDFSNAAWGKIEVTPTLNNVVAPDGSLTATRVVATVTSGQHRLDQTTASKSGMNTASIYAKPAGYSKITIRIGTLGNSVIFDLATGTVNTVAGYEATITAAGNGYYRCTLRRTTNAGINEIIRYNINDDTGANTFTGDGVKGVDFAMPQYEYGEVTAYQQILTTFPTDWLTAFPETRFFQNARSVSGAPPLLAPCTNYEQPVGLMLADFKPVTGPTGANLFTGNTTSTAGWTIGSAVTAVSSNGTYIEFTGGGASSSSANNWLSTQVGLFTQYGVYKVTFSAQWVSGAGNLEVATDFYAGFGIPSTVNASNMVTYTGYIYADSPTFTGKIVLAASAGSKWRVQNIDVHLVSLGKNYIQSTNTMRPTITARTNLFTTPSEFPNGVADLNTATGPVSATTMTGYDGAIQMGWDGVTNAVAYKSSLYTPTVAKAYWTFSCVVEMADGLPPSFGTAVNVAKSTFGIIIGGIGVTVAAQELEWLGGSRWRVYGTRLLTAVNNSIGIIKYAANDSRLFKVTAFQVEAHHRFTKYQKVTSVALYDTNNFPASLFFDGTDDKLVAGTGGGSALGTTATCAATRSLTVAQTLYGDTLAASFIGVETGLNTSGTPVYTTGNGSAFSSLVGEAPVIPLRPTTQFAWYNGTTKYLEVALDNTLSQVIARTPDNVPGTMLGANSAGLLPYSGFLTSMVNISRVLNDGERQLLADYFTSLTQKDWYPVELFRAADIGLFNDYTRWTAQLTTVSSATAVNVTAVGDPHAYFCDFACKGNQTAAARYYYSDINAAGVVVDLPLTLDERGVACLELGQKMINDATGESSYEYIAKSTLSTGWATGAYSTTALVTYGVVNAKSYKVWWDNDAEGYILPPVEFVPYAPILPVPSNVARTTPYAVNILSVAFYATAPDVGVDDWFIWHDGNPKSGYPFLSSYYASQEAYDTGIWTTANSGDVNTLPMSPQPIISNVGSFGYAMNSATNLAETISNGKKYTLFDEPIGFTSTFTTGGCYISPPYFYTDKPTINYAWLLINRVLNAKENAAYSNWSLTYPNTVAPYAPIK